MPAPKKTARKRVPAATPVRLFEGDKHVKTWHFGGVSGTYPRTNGGEEEDLNSLFDKSA